MYEVCAHNFGTQCINKHFSKVGIQHTTLPTLIIWNIKINLNISIKNKLVGVLCRETMINNKTETRILLHIYHKCSYVIV